MSAAKTKDAFYRGFPWNASLAIRALSTGNLTPLWAQRQGMKFSGPVLEPGLILTKVVDIVKPALIDSCGVAGDREWFAASQPTDMPSEQSDFAKIEADNERL